MLSEHRHESQAALQRALLHWSEELLRDALNQRHAISLLLSGGSTPLPFYRELAQSELPWNRMNVALVDERWVDTADASSNERAIRQAFAAQPAVWNSFVGMKNSASSAAAASDECNARYAQLPWPPTLCVLGMGADGHTASLFAGADGLQHALTSKQFCAPILARQTAVTGNCTERMTMTLWALLQSQHIALVFTGREKSELYQRAKECEDQQLPVSLVIQRASSLEVFWCE